MSKVFQGSEMKFRFELNALAFALAGVFASQSGFAAANAPVVDDSTNPPSISIEGNQDNTAWLLYNRYGDWKNVRAVSNGQVDSITGISLSGVAGEDSLSFSVSEKTDINLIGTATDDGSSGNVEGIVIQSSPNAAENDRVVTAYLHDVTIHAESTDPQFSRAKGIWVHGAHDFVGGDEGETKASTLTIDGNLDITAISQGAAIGINVGDELGDANGHGTGILELSGDRNVIEVQQTRYAEAPTQGLAIASAGILGSNQAHITIESLVTEIRTETHHTGLAPNQGGIVVEHASTLKVDNEVANSLKIDSTATNAADSNYLHGISVDRNADVVYPDADGSEVELGKVTETEITLRPNTQTNAYGLASYGKGSITSDGSVTVTLDVGQENIGGFNRFVAVYADTAYVKGYANNGGRVELNGGLNVVLPQSVKPGQTNVYALLASGEPNKSTTRNPYIAVNGSSDDVHHLNGNVNAVYGGEIKLSMANASSYLTGWADNHAEDSIKEGSVDLSLTNGAVWNVVSQLTASGAVDSDRSVVDSLNLGGGTLNMSYASRNGLNDWEDEGHRQLLVLSGSDKEQGLTGTGGTICMDINLADEGSEDEGLHLDQIIVKGHTEGTHELSVNFVNGLGSVPVDKWHSEKWLIEQASGSMTLTGPNGASTFSGRGMVSQWGVRFVPEGEESKLDTDRDSLQNTSAGMPDDGKGHWYLVRYDHEAPSEITDNVTIGTSASQALAYMADLEDLRKRLGEVRYGAQAGAWVKAFGKQDRVKASGGRGFKQEVYGINLGLDALAGTSENSSWLVGGAFRYANADQDGVGIGGSTGDLDEYSFKVYATWMHEKGSYADFVLQAGRYEQEIDGLDNTGAGKSHADYGTWGFGASVEVGHMFSFGEETDDRRWFNHWFVEPQLELSYFHAKGADYSTSTGLKVSQDNADFLTGRAGLVIGKKFSYGSIDDLDRRYFQIAVIGGVKHEFLGGDQTIRYTGVDGIRRAAGADDIAGTRFYYGLNADWQMSDDWRLYAQIDREEGDHYTKDYDVSVGLKYSF